MGNLEDLENIKEKIKIPATVDLAIKNGIEKGRKEKKLKRIKKTYKKVATAAAVIIVIATVGIINPNVVKAIPGVQSIFNLVNYNNIGENLDIFEQFSTSVNKTINKNGIKITIDEIAIDNNTLAITSIIEGNNLKENHGYMGSIKLNGKQLVTYDSKDKKVDNKLMMVTNANISDLELSDKVDVDLNIVWVDDVKGPWDFKFKVNKADKPTNSKTINIDKSINIPNSVLKLEKLVISPLGNTITYSGKYDKVNESMKNGIFDFLVIDDKGKILQGDNGSGSSSKVKYDGKIEIIDDLTNVKSLTVVPIFNAWGSKIIEINNISCQILQTTMNSTDIGIPQEVLTKTRPVTAKEKSDGYAFDTVTHVFNIDKARQFSTIDKLVNQVIKVGESNTVLIKNIEATEKETKVTFKIEGNGAYFYNPNINYAVILDEKYNDIERAEDGARAVLENKEERIVSIKLPPIDKTKKYKIALPSTDQPEIVEQYKMNINLTK